MLRLMACQRHPYIIMESTDSMIIIILSVGTLPLVLNSDVSPPGTHSVRVVTTSGASRSVSYIISDTDQPTGNFDSHVFYNYCIYSFTGEFCCVYFIWKSKIRENKVL